MLKSIVQEMNDVQPTEAYYLHGLLERSMGLEAGSSS